MIKKILIGFAASAFALTLYAPTASACGGADKKVAKEEKKDNDKVADKKQKPTKKTPKKNKKAPKKGTKVSKR